MRAVVCVLLPLLVLILPRPAPGDPLQGNLYRIGSQRSHLLYTFRMDPDADNGVWRSSYRTPAGDLVAEDELTVVDGRLARYRYTRHNTGEEASVERVGDDLLYVQELGGKRRERREKFDATVTVGPTVIPYIQRHWSALMSGREVKTRHCVLDRLRSFVFRLALDRRHPVGPGLTVISMTAVDPVVRSAVSPAYFVLSSDGRTFQSVKGRALPRIPGGKAGRPVEAELTVETRTDSETPPDSSAYRAPSPCDGFHGTDRADSCH